MLQKGGSERLPTDAAFAKIPSDQLNALLNDKNALVKVLTYHVVPGKVKAAQVAKLSLSISGLQPPYG